MRGAGWHLVPASMFAFLAAHRGELCVLAPAAGWLGSPHRISDAVRKVIEESGAFWKTGMFANQNSATKLRNRFTLEQLTAEFGLDDNAKLD